MQRYEIIEAPPQPRTFFVYDYLTSDEFNPPILVGVFETEEEALDFLNNREVRDKLLI